ncbi:hypothetical protein [Actinomadura chibensis]|uniref:Secreted protein n=1 Tax=Actinomadura chibensis TaxID=392828 RepID=A0A5D0NTS7_9ACTN|nr:hypothetical protein [Actinomadura chibensis]TYB47767.1 hypothetical protein FXF69_00445 [Actinomadura chibensis]
MNKQRLATRAAGVSLAAVLGLGIAGPASAATAQPARTAVPVTAVQQPAASGFSAADTAAMRQIGFSTQEIQQLQDAARKGGLGTLIKILKKAGKLKSAVKAAKKGWGAFKKWYSKLPRPVRWALKAAGWSSNAWDLYKLLKGY